MTYFVMQSVSLVMNLSDNHLVDTIAITECVQLANSIVIIAKIHVRVDSKDL